MTSDRDANADAVYQFELANKTLARLLRELGEMPREDRRGFRLGFQAGLDQAERNARPWRFRTHRKEESDERR